MALTQDLLEDTTTTQFSNLFNGSVDPETLQFDKNTKKWYFKGFLMNNKINRRKFGIIDPDVIDRDIDTFIGLPLTEVTEGKRKGDHAQPEDSGIIENRFPSKYDFVNRAIQYYRDFGKATIINIFKPDRNIFEASKNNPNADLTWYAQYETTNEELAKRIEAAKNDPENNPVPKVSPSVYGVRWHYNDKKEIIVDQFVGTHVGIVDRGAYGDVAYIKPEICNIDGKTCYYKLLEASDIEGINNNAQENNDMSNSNDNTNSKQGLGIIEKAIFNTHIPTTLEGWTNSGYALEVVDQNNIDLNSIARQANGEYIIFKKSANNNNQQTQNNNMSNNNNNNNNNQTQEPQQPTNNNNIQTPNPPTTNINGNQYVHINDVRNLIAEETSKIKAELTNQFTAIIEGQKKESAKANILVKYFDGLANHKELAGKIDMAKIQAEKEKYAKLDVDVDTLETILQNSVFNPKNTTAANFINKFGSGENNNGEQNGEGDNGNNKGSANKSTEGNNNTKTSITNSVTSIPPKGSGADNLSNFMGNPAQGHNAYRVDGDNSPNGNGATGINVDPNTGSTSGNTGEFKSSDNFSAASYNDNYNGGNSSKRGNERTGHDITGDSIPKKFKHLINGNGVT